MKNIILKEDINTIISSKSWKAIMIFRKIKSISLFGKLAQDSNTKKIMDSDQNNEHLFKHVKLSTREQDKIIFFRDEGFIENWN
jgi:hypothetical protein